MREVDLAVVIVNYNTKNLLCDCLQSIYENVSGLEFKVLVVDNNSADGSPEVVRDSFRQVKLLQNQANVGFAKAVNQAIKASSSRLILLLNSDTRVVDGAFEKMVEFMDLHPECGALSCQVLYSDGSVQTSGLAFPNLVDETFKDLGIKRLFGSSVRAPMYRILGRFAGRTAGAYLRNYSSSSEPWETDYVTGACLMIRREAVESIGLLDEGFFMYFEDADLCRRLRQDDWKVYVLPTAQIVHLVRQSIKGKIKPKMLKEEYRSTFYYYNKHRGRLAFCLLKAVTIISVLARCLGLYVAWLFHPSRRPEISLTTRAFWQVVNIAWRTKFIPSISTENVVG